MWLEDAVRAARGFGSGEPSNVERALCSNLLRGFLGWPAPEEMRGFTVLSSSTPDEVRAVREDMRRVMLSVIDAQYAPYWRKRFAVLALANLYAMGIGDAETLKRCDRLPWLLPALREYVRDALCGVGPMSLGLAPFDRNRAVEEEIAEADGPLEIVRADEPAGVSRSAGGSPPVPTASSPTVRERRERPCDLRALAQYERALEIRPDLAAGNAKLEDVYEVVRTKVHDRAEDGRLPDFQTWRRYVNRARHDPAAPKRTPRAGREGRNVVRREGL